MEKLQPLMITPRKAKAQMTRQEILDAAEEVFFETGFSGATLEKIAQRSGVTRGAIYWHFENKVEVFEAVFRRTISSYEELLGDITQTATSLEEFEAFTIQQLRSIATDKKKHRALCILLLRHEHLPSEPQILALQEETQKRFQEMLVEFFQRIRLAPAVSGNFPTPRVAAEMVSFYMQEMLLQFLLYPKMIPLAKNADTYVRLFFQGFKALGLKGNAGGKR